jgi:methylated-DNA-[protein]-cysteine S-methyltransferase
VASFLFEGPFCMLFAEVTEAGVRRLEFMGGQRVPPPRPGKGASQEASAEPMTMGEQHVATLLETQLTEYFEGRRREFDVPIDIAEGSDFRRRVWQVIAEIPYGKTLSYADVAGLAGNPTAYRAAGSACGANPIVIIIPCHRVVGSDGRLHGFGGGLDTKALLLAHEGQPVAHQGQLVAV